ncbi:MAG TPA: carbon-nitrogen hydrolase family protein [Spirochaetia bacterium]|nr:carbon-nitrogen hydrolase family protein [Spirochaetia bacterium]HBI38139.1 carbon-nitrogen hydrolase family protein [Spirochaetia bacterium]
MEIKIAIAQIKSFRNNTKRNIQKHIEFIELASKHHSDIILFPEMSLTGYETKNAHKLVFEINDSRLDILKVLSEKYNQIIVTGAPLKIDEKQYIGSFIIFPNQDVEIYIKKYLHEGEELYFNSHNDFDYKINLKGEKISCAICYDIEKDKHIEDAVLSNSTLYMPSIFYSKAGINSGLQRLSYISRSFSIPVMMSNYSGKCFGIQSGGNSSAWNKDGKIIITANDKDECLLLLTKQQEEWSGELVSFYI